MKQALYWWRLKAASASAQPRGVCTAQATGLALDVCRWSGSSPEYYGKTYSKVLLA